jgi:hypothetical protein
MKIYAATFKLVVPYTVICLGVNYATIIRYLTLVEHAIMYYHGRT